MSRRRAALALSLASLLSVSLLEAPAAFGAVAVRILSPAADQPVFGPTQVDVKVDAG